MQDGVGLAKSSNVTTVSELQQYPVDFHILPTCPLDNTKPCTATGEYINDDGETLDMSQRNHYQLSYTMD